MPAVSLTDHGSMAGAVQLWKATRGTGVKPVIGCEVYVADDRKAHEKGNAHLTLLAADNTGYSNLIKLSLARLPRGLLLQAARRLGAARAPLAGADRALRLPLRPRLQGARGEPRSRRRGRARPPRRRSSAATTSTSSCRTRTSTCRRGSCRSSSSSPRSRSSRRSRPATCTTSATPTRARTRRSSASSRATRSRTRTTGSSRPTTSTSSRPRRWLLDFPGHEDAMRRTLEVAERCNVEIELGRILLPNFDVPEGRDSFDYLVEQCEKGLAQALRHGHAGAPGAAALRAEDDQGDGVRRLLPDRLGLHRASRAATAIGVGPGRGSAAGSLVAYCLEITTSTRSATTCSSSASSTRAASRCPTSTSTSPSRAASASSTTCARSTATTASRRSSPSRRWPRAPRCATPAACSRCRTASSTRSRSSSRKARARRSTSA